MQKIIEPYISPYRVPDTNIQCLVWWSSPTQASLLDKEFMEVLFRLTGAFFLFLFTALLCFSPVFEAGSRNGHSCRSYSIICFDSQISWWTYWYHLPITQLLVCIQFPVFLPFHMPFYPISPIRIQEFAHSVSRPNSHEQDPLLTVCY